VALVFGSTDYKIIDFSQGLDKGAAFGTGSKTDTNPKGRIRFFGIFGRQNPCWIQDRPG
jgi:hypothetical protein